MAANDNGHHTGSVDRKRKLTISPPNEGEATHKFPRAAYVQMRSNDTEGTYQSDDDAHDSPGTHADVSDAAATVRTNLSSVGRKTRTGTSKSALASRKIRDRVASKTHAMSKKRLKNWQKKMTDLDPDVQFDPENTCRVRHSPCSTWLLVKEAGDATRFKQHVEGCRVKPIAAGGTLMAWFKVKEVGASGDDEKKESKKCGVKMPCRGVSDMDEVLIDQYLKRTGSAGGGGRSIHIISKERFKKKFQCLTRAKKNVVQEMQRAERVWQNDHLNLRVHATDCKRFTFNHSLSLSLCPKCEELLTLNSFTIAIQKKQPEEKNLKFTNKQYLNSALGQLYVAAKGLRVIIEHPVSDAIFFFKVMLLILNH